MVTLLLWYNIRYPTFPQPYNVDYTIPMSLWYQYWQIEPVKIGPYCQIQLVQISQGVYWKQIVNVHLFRLFPRVSIVAHNYNKLLYSLTYWHPKPKTLVFTSNIFVEYSGLGNANCIWKHSKISIIYRCTTWKPMTTLPLLHFNRCTHFLPLFLYGPYDSNVDDMIISAWISDIHM